MDDMQDFLNNLPDEEDRAALIVEHPNGISAMFFDTQGGELFTDPGYAYLYKAFKTAGLDYEMNDDVNDAKTDLMEDGFLLLDFVYPGIYDVDEIAAMVGDEYIVSFQGEDFPVDSIIATDLPIM